MKKELEFYITEINPYLFQGPIEEVVSDILKLKEEHSNYKDLKIEFDMEIKDFDLYGTRLETDEEHTKRLEFEKRMEIHKQHKIKFEEAKERQLYEELKKKYETNCQ